MYSVIVRFDAEFNLMYYCGAVQATYDPRAACIYTSAEVAQAVCDTLPGEGWLVHSLVG